VTVKANMEAIAQLRTDTEDAVERLQGQPRTGMPTTLGEALDYVYRRVGYVQKGGRTTFGDRYSYVGEADLIAAIRPVMAAAGLIGPYPVRVEHAVVEHTPTRKGNAQTRHEVTVTYRLMHGHSGDYLELQVPGLGVDSGDKGTAKAMTGAYKYVLRQLWCIETGDDPDDTPSALQEGIALGVTLHHDPVTQEHDDEWADERVRFCTKLRDLDLSYEAVRAWGIDTGQGKPSTWGHDGRVQFMRALLGGQHPDLWQPDAGASG